MLRFLLKRPSSLLAALAAAALLVGPMPAVADPVQGGSLTTFTSGYRTLNPAVQSGQATGTPGSQIFAGLILAGDDFEAEPYLAESWEVSEDGLTYTFRLVEGARFHDGEAITSADVAYSLEVVKSNHPFGRAMFGNVETVETPDPLTAVVRLSAPTPGLLLSMQPLLLPILPQHIYDDGQDIRTHPRNMQDVVGSGPFKVEHNDPNQRLVLVRNEDFFIEDRPYLDRIVIELVRDPLTRVLMIENGELELTGFTGIRPTDAERLEQVDGITVTQQGYGAIGFIHYLEMNLRGEPFSDHTVRRALAHAIDSGFIADVLFGGRAVPGTGPLHTENPYYTPDVPSYEPDLSKAAALLDEAGYPVGADGERFSFTLDVPNWALQSHVPYAEYVRAQLDKLGIGVELRRAPDFGTWVSRVSSFEYEATINGSFNYPDPVIGVHRHFLCDNIINVIWANTQGYCDEDMDALLETAATATDDMLRRDTYAEVQRKAVEDLVFIYLPQEYATTVYHDHVKNPPLGVFGILAPWDEVYVVPK